MSKTQKQNYAKSRQQASNIVTRQPSSFRGVPDPDNGSDDRLDDDTTCRDWQMMGKEAQNHTRFPSYPPLGASIPADSTGCLDDLKRRLLQEPDLAAVSAARPLEIAFASAHEAEHFGKRRRLTETDRKRLSATCGNQPTLAFPRAHYWRDRDTVLDQIQIKITGPPDSQRLRNSQGLHTPPDRPANHDFPQSPDPPRPRLSANARYGAASRSDLSVSRAPSSAGSPIPHRQHFTVEERVIGEQINRSPRLPSSHRPQRGLSCSPTETLPASPTLFATDSLSNGTQNWLPQPNRHTIPSSPLLSRLAAAHTPTMASHVPYESQKLSDSYTCRTEEHYPAAPVKIFGQLVRMRSGDAADFL